MDSALRIMILEDNPEDAELQAAALMRARMACRTLRARGHAEFMTQLEAFSPDAVLSGPAHAPPADGSALDVLRDRKPNVPFIVVSGAIGEEQTVELLKRGAADYVLKSNLDRLPWVLKRALSDAESRKRTARMTSVRAMRSEIAFAIIRAAHPQELFEAACRTAVEYGRFRMAWIGQVTPDASKLEPVAWSGHNDGYLDKAAHMVSHMRQEHCRGKGAVFRRFGSIVVNDIQQEKLFALRDEALTRGYRSTIALPLIAVHRVAAVLKLYASERDFFGPEERKVLADVAGDLSVALHHHAREERLSRLAYHDALTGLANRRLLYEHVKRELAKAHRQKTMVAMVFVDLDNFKSVNDTMGHNAGDRLLREVSSRIVSCTREGDIVARLGGDEFVMVLPLQSGRETVLPIVERVLESVSRTIRVAHRKINVTCSIGVAVYPQDGTDYASLLRSADAAMYRAKAPEASRPSGRKVVDFRFASSGR